MACSVVIGKGLLSVFVYEDILRRAQELHRAGYSLERFDAERAHFALSRNIDSYLAMVRAALAAELSASAGDARRAANG